VDQAPEAITSTKARLRERRPVRTRAAAWRGRYQVEAAVWPTRVVVVDIEVKDAFEVATSDEEDPVEAFATHRAHKRSA